MRSLDGFSQRSDRKVFAELTSHLFASCLVAELVILLNLLEKRYIEVSSLLSISHTACEKNSRSLLDVSCFSSIATQADICYVP